MLCNKQLFKSIKNYNFLKKTDGSAATGQPYLDIIKSGKKKIIECTDFKKNHVIDAHIEYKANKTLSKQIDAFLCLTEEEKLFKKGHENTLQAIQDSYDNLQLE